MKIVAWVLMCLLCIVLAAICLVAAAEIHGGFAILVIVFFSAAVVSIVLAVQS